ncbi:R3H domain-containing protein 1 [Tolypocladium paradoxum]|uniref:R3H domain-containing protein 1 n=1 Tax=Tolypocladium paradoxum TaxID=94208 RepID=A0A2S4KTY2_9HYPO|nr:R3H domain-containing protein 1 [Tolypocladium paradoxum]
MATTQVSPDLSRSSFAKVAASVSEDLPSGPTPATDQTASVTHEAGTTAPVIVSGASADAARSQNALPTKPGGVYAARGNLAAVERIAASLTDLKLGSRVPSLVVDGSGFALERQRALVSRESASDESQKCDSSSELGTKPPSLDGKSITSGTTFAMDEKESLRPDDSASVKATAEDDDAFSIRGSFIAGSRMSSEVAARARGVELGDIPERKLAHPPPGIHSHGLLTPQSSSSEQPPTLNPAMPLSAEGSSDALNVIYRQAPDEKLLDALASPRDRYFLLRLEKDVIDFVQDSKEPYMDLPPSNSFCRMLTHKLADYYHMTHSYEPHIGSVRIFRTPFCRVPPSLATMAPLSNASASSTPPPAVLPKKIMRRGQDSEGGPFSGGASKATSESGSDAKDKQPLAKEKLSREEREEMYKLARERIFGSSEEGVQENEGENGMSRTSSVSATNKTNAAKRGKTGKQRRDDSDSFDSRNQYTAYWGPQQQTWVPQPQTQFVPHAHGQFNAQTPPAYTGQVAPVYDQQPAAYPGMPGMAPSPAYPTYGMPQYPPPPPQQRYQPGGSPMAAYGSPVPPAAVPQGWQPGFSPPVYQPRGPAPPASQAQVGIPYAFGQLPANINPHDPKSQHPIPGSYNRNHAFNPKTQSFVPGGNGMHPAQPPQPPFTAPGSHHGSPLIGTPHLAYAGYQTGVLPPPYGGGYCMARQGSNNSIPSYHGPPHAQHVPPMQTMPHIPQQHLHQNLPTHIPTRPAVPQGPNLIYSHLPTYGNPATLPQKPATGI